MGVQLDCYVECASDGTHKNFWIPREQIGFLLGYSNAEAIKKINIEHKEEFQHLSMSVKFSNVDKEFEQRLYDIEANRAIQQKYFTIKTNNIDLYNYEGLLRLCEYSEQSNSEQCKKILELLAQKILGSNNFITQYEKLYHTLKSGEFRELVTLPKVLNAKDLQAGHVYVDAKGCPLMVVDNENNS